MILFRKITGILICLLFIIFLFIICTIIYIWSIFGVVFCLVNSWLLCFWFVIYIYIRIRVIYCWISGLFGIFWWLITWLSCLINSTIIRISRINFTLINSTICIWIFIRNSRRLLFRLTTQIKIIFLFLYWFFYSTLLNFRWLIICSWLFIVIIYLLCIFIIWISC